MQERGLGELQFPLQMLLGSAVSLLHLSCDKEKIRAPAHQGLITFTIYSPLCRLTAFPFPVTRICGFAMQDVCPLLFSSAAQFTTLLCLPLNE